MLPENIPETQSHAGRSAMVEPEEQRIIKVFQIDLGSRADRSWSM
jgi:hypothetical protein